MAFRKRMSKGSSKANFRKNTGIHKVNSTNPRRMRGGIRL